MVKKYGLIYMNYHKYNYFYYDYKTIKHSYIGVC